jgi:aspartyl-tRNA(Asn)/glutamyl-tRNA(Gln) amidotransferase subunit C
MSARIDAQEVRRIAALAHLGLTAEEEALYARQLQEILDYAEQVRQVDTRDVPPTSHVLTSAPVERADEVRPSLPVAEVMANAPEPAPYAHLFKVPRVIGG